MSINYGFSLKGTSHEKSGKPCQDCSVIQEFSNGCTILIACDGVGSSKKAEIASKTAAKTALNFCIKNFPSQNTPKMLEAMIHMAFNAALKKIIEIAKDNGEDLSSYYTTLHLAVYDEVSGLVSYGHVGDGTIIGLNASSGKYELIKEAMKGEDSESVIPLQFGQKYWDIGSTTESYAAILISTDGLSDNLFAPKSLKNSQEKLNIFELRKFLDKNYNKKLSLGNLKEIKKFLIEFFEDDKYKNITSDDKTMVVSISKNLEAVTLDDKYYEEIDIKCSTIQDSDEDDTNCKQPNNSCNFNNFWDAVTNTIVNVLANKSKKL